MTVKLYDDYRLVSARATVTQCVPGEGFFDIATDRTVFFPGGGGQEPDWGSLNGEKVITVYEKDGDVFHRISSPVEAGTEVTLCADWNKRLSDSVIHTGEHILSGLALKLFGAKNVGFHMGADFATADFAIPLDGEKIADLEKAVNRAIRENTPVNVSYPDGAGLAALPLRKRPETDEPLRVVEVVGADLCACCGTHVSRTGEVGLLKILSAEKLRGGTRLSFICGEAAFDLFCAEHSDVRTLGKMFSAKDGDVVAHVKKQADDLAAASRKISALTSELARASAAALFAAAKEEDGEKYVRAELDLGADALIPTAEALCALGKCHVFLSAEGRYVLAASKDSSFDLKAQNDELRTHGARGGGRDKLFSGRLG